MTLALRDAATSPHPRPWLMLVRLLPALLLAWLGLNCLPAPAQAGSGLPPIIGPGPGTGGCDPAHASCGPPTCTLADQIMGKCHVGDPLPGDPGGGVCLPAPGGNPNCSSSAGATTTPGGAGGEVAVAGGNPINLVSGDKYQLETDVEPLSGVLGLELRRHYNSLSSHAGLMGAGWHMSYETVLYDEGSQIQIVQADGQRLMFQRGSGSRSLLCTTPRPQDGQVRIVLDGRGKPTWVWRWPDGRQLTFGGGSGGGHPLQAVAAPTGEILTLAYSPRGDLVQVRDPQGRKLDFIYGGPRHALQAVDTPVGRIDYQIDDRGRLVEATRHGDGGGLSTRVYHYEAKYDGGHSTALTGISLRTTDAVTHEVSEQRLSTYAYDRDGKAILTTRGEPRQLKDGKPLPGTGIEQLDVAYVDKPLPSEGPIGPDGEVHPRQFGKTVITNSLGQRSELTSALIGGHFRLIEFRGPGCSTCGEPNMRYAYNRAGQVLRAIHLDERGAPLSAEVTQYDDHGRVLRTGMQSEAGAKVPLTHWTERYEYADTRFPDGSVAIAAQPSLVARPSIVEGREHVIRIAYDDAGQPTRMTEQGFSPVDDDGHASPAGTPIARTIDYRYVRIGSRTVLSEIDGPLPNGPQASPADSDITRFEYDARGQFLTRVVHPGNLAIVYGQRNVAGEPSRVVFSDGVREISEQISRNPQGQVNHVVATARLLAAGHEACADCAPSTQNVDFGYDAAGHLVRLTDAAGRLIQAQFDVAGRLVERRDGQGYAQQLSWDDEDHVRAVSLHEPGQAAPLRAAYQFYDAQGHLDARLLPDGRFDRQVTLPASVTSAFQALQARVQQRSFASTVDDFGHVRVVHVPGQTDRTAVYDAAGNITRMAWSDGRAVAYRRGPGGELLQKTVTGTDGRVVDRVTVRHAGSVIAEVDDPVQSTRYDVDAWGRAVATRVSLRALQDRRDAFVFATHFDPDTGLAQSKTLADGRQLLFERDDAAKGRTTRAISLRSPFWARVAGWLPASWGRWVPSSTMVTDIVVSPFDGLQRMSWGNGVALDRSFDIAGRITSQEFDARPTKAQLYRADYRYGTGSHIDAVQGRLLGEAFDTRLAPGTATATQARATATAAPRLIPAMAETAATVEAVRDSDGRLAGDGKYHYSYDWQGLVTQVADARSGAVVARYTYNASRQRVSKTVAGRTTFFLWHDGRVVAEIDERGELTRQYVYLEEGHVTMPIAEIESVPGESERVLAIHADHRGQPVAMTDSQRRVVWRASVDAYGQAVPGAVEPGVRPATLNLRLPGQYYDRETGLHDNFNRSYDPRAEIGGQPNPNRASYLQPDPMGLPGSPAAYLYAQGDPLNKIDPLGLYESDIHYYMTYFLAIVAGVNADDARVIALGDQYVDNNDATTPVDGTNWLTTVGSIFVNQPKLLDYHFVLSGTNGKVPSGVGTDFHDPTSPQLTNLFNASSRAPTICAKDQFFGEALHAFEDTFAHRDKSDKPYDALKFGLGIGHGFDGKNPDFTYNHGSWTVNEDRTLEMELEVFHRLQAYGGNQTNSTVNEIDLVPILKAFNKIHETGDTTHEYGLTGGSIDSSEKVKLLNSTLSDWGYGDVDLLHEAKQGYDLTAAANNRNKYLCTASGARFTTTEYPGTILPSTPCP